MKIIILRILSFGLFAYMSWTVVQTSLESNLFLVWDSLMQIPWMIATLEDFYVNTLWISLWVFYREHSALTAAVWTVLFIVLGSIATSFYLFLQTMQISSQSPISELLLPRPKRQA